MRISLIGRVRVEFDDGVIDESQLVGRQGRLLFVYLVAEHGRAVPRDELAEALWGETSPIDLGEGPDGARKQAAPPACAARRRGPVAPDRRVRLLPPRASGRHLGRRPRGRGSDGRRREGARRREPRPRARAWRLSRPRCCSDRSSPVRTAPGSRRSGATWPTFARWRSPRSPTRTSRADDASAAADAAEQLITLAPLRESGYRRLMEAQAAAGNSAEALGVYERCRQLLADELGAYPSPETDAIYRALLELPPVREFRCGRDRRVGTSRLRRRARPRHRRRMATSGDRRSYARASPAQLSRSASEGSESMPPFRTIAAPECSAPRYDGSGAPAASDRRRPPAAARLAPDVDTDGERDHACRSSAANTRPATHRVGLQACDDGPRGNPNDERACKSNARMYVESPSVIGVVGPLTSTCVHFAIPILNEAPGGAVPSVSPTATYVGTRGAQASDSDKPESYYPTGQRNFARVIPTDDVQAAADALVARDLRVRRVYALGESHPPSTQFVNYFLQCSPQARNSGRRPRRVGSQAVKVPPGDSAPDAHRRDGRRRRLLAVAAVPTSIGLLKALRARLGPGRPADRAGGLRSRGCTPRGRGR